MGVMKVMLLLLVLFNFSFPASFAPLANNLDSENPSKKMREKQVDESNDSATGGGNGIVNQSKFAHAGARGGGGGRSAGEGNNGNGGQANSSPQGGGTAVIPVYAAAGAGAAGQRKNHNGAAGICCLCRKGRLLILVATALTSLLSHISM